MEVKRVQRERELIEEITTRFDKNRMECMYVCTHECMYSMYSFYVLMSVYVYRWVYECVCMYVYVCVCMCLYAYFLLIIITCIHNMYVCTNMYIF